MTTVTRLDDLRDAIAALDEGRTLASDVERLTEEALSSGAVTPNEALRELRSALNRGVSARIIAHLQLESAGPWKRAAPRFAELAVAAPSSVPVTASRDAEAGSPDSGPVMVGRSAEPRVPFAALKRQTSDGARWVDPESYPARSDESKMPGQLLGNRYRLDRALDVGVMGTVYLATDLEAGDTPVAVTLLRPEFRSFSEALALLRTEVRVTRMLRHPNIARVYALNSDRPGVYLVGEHLDGWTLEAFMREMNGRVPLQEACRIVADVCAALDYAHDLDVVHGDLQPANVFIGPTGRAKLMNFGLARVAATRNGRFDPRRLGSQTLAYASPEMLEGRAPDRRDDVYSLGCIIYSALSGMHPFDSRTATEARDLDLVMPPLHNLARDQNMALAQALVFDRAYRMPGVMELLSALGWAADASDAEPASAVTVATPVASAVAPGVAMAAAGGTASFAAPAAEALAAPAPATAPASFVAPTESLASTSAAGAAPASTAPTSTAPASTAPTTAASGSDVPTLTDSEPPPAPRPARRRQGRLPLPSIKATPRPPPPPPASRGYLMPIVIVLSLLLVAAGGGYFFYKRHAGAGSTTSFSGEKDSVSRSAPPSSAAPAASAAPVMADNASASAAATTAGATHAAATPPPPAYPVAAQQAGNPSAPTDSNTAAGALPLLRPLPKAAAAMANGDNCPYPREAMDKGVTGTVLLLVYVSPDGKPAKSRMDRTSGSEALDVAATRCVEQFARFAAPSEGTSGYWGRVRFKWSVGS